jgi:hypothetical protein
LVELQSLSQTASHSSDKEFVSFLLLNFLKHNTAYILEQLVDVKIHLVQVVTWVETIRLHRYILPKINFIKQYPLKTGLFTRSLKN